MSDLNFFEEYLKVLGTMEGCLPQTICIHGMYIKESKAIPIIFERPW